MQETTMREQFRSMTFAAACAVLMAPALTHAQQPPPVDHSAHAAPQADAADDCMTAQSKVAVTATTALERLEAARQTNEPAALRAAVDEALLALGALLAATEPCRTPAADPHAGHAPPRSPAPAADPHAGHGPPAAAPAAPAAKPAADPHAGHAAPSKPPAKPAATPADPHAGHAAPAPPKPAAAPAPKPAAKITPFATDPKQLVCAQAVDPDAAPSTTYKGKTYYFCSAADRLRFIMNPETALKGGGGQ
jgi:YHS domain-containing protein